MPGTFSPGLFVTPLPVSYTGLPILHRHVSVSLPTRSRVVIHETLWVNIVPTRLTISPDFFNRWRREAGAGGRTPLFTGFLIKSVFTSIISYLRGIFRIRISRFRNFRFRFFRNRCIGHHPFHAVCLACCRSFLETHKIPCCFQLLEPLTHAITPVQITYGAKTGSRKVPVLRERE